MNITPGLVSTIIPVFNRPEMLKKAVESVIGQTYRPVEIIIVDDGSTDATPAVCREYARKHPDMIRVVPKIHEGKAGLSREAGRLIASGEFIQYLDSDDILAPDKFRVMVGELKKNPDCGIAYCYTRRYNERESPRDVPCRRTGETFARMYPDFLRERFWHTVTPIFRREVCERAGPWSDLGSEEDWEYESRIAKQGVKLCLCKEFLADVIDHDYERMAGKKQHDLVSLQEKLKAYKLIYRHARDFGIAPDDPNMRLFARWPFFISRLYGAAGRKKEARECFEFAEQILGTAGKRGIFRAYRALAEVFGWERLGWFCMQVDRLGIFNNRLSEKAMDRFYAPKS